MARRRTRAAFSLVVALVTGGCQQDFDAFSYREEEGSDPNALRRDGGEAPPPDAQPADDAGLRVDASTSVPPSSDAGPDAAHPDPPVSDGGGGAPQQDGAVTDAQAGEAGAPDAGPNDAEVDAGADPAELEAMCLPVFELELPPQAPDCLSCGCAECGGVLLACLDQGNGEDAQCAAVLTCALENACQDWDCYCLSPSCGAPSKDGDGPCVAEMNAAAGGGGRTQVEALRQGGDDNSPLVRAMRAISCTLGLHRRSPSGPVTGRCEASCMPQ